MTAPLVRPCPGCGEGLVLTDPVVSCPRCGRAYEARIAPSTDDAAYRQAPVVDLVPHPARPPAWGLWVHSQHPDLHVAFGGPFFPPKELAIGLFLFTALLLFPALSSDRWIPICLSLLGLFGALMWPVLVYREVLLVSHATGTLTWERRHGQPHETRSVALTEVRRIVLGDAGLRIELASGERWELGSGRRVPRGVLFWLAARLVDHVPPPAPPPE